MPQDVSVIRRLPLLEHSWRAVMATEGLEHEVLERVVLRALDSPSNYWPRLALAWLEDGFPVDSTIAEALRSLHERRSIAQQSRHRALRLVRAYAQDDTD